MQQQDHGPAFRWNPASSRWIESPLIPSSRRARTPIGRTSGDKGESDMASLMRRLISNAWPPERLRSMRDRPRGRAGFSA